MQITDLILLAQTIILFLTGLVVCYYAKETYRLRKETGNQNLILAEQLKELKEKNEYQKKKDLSLLEPIFHFTGGTHGQVVKCKFTNKGSTVQNIIIKALDDFKIRISPENVLGNYVKGFIEISEFSKIRNKELMFDIFYENKYGDAAKKSFFYKIDELRIGEIVD